MLFGQAIDCRQAPSVVGWNQGHRQHGSGAWPGVPIGLAAMVMGCTILRRSKFLKHRDPRGQSVVDSVEHVAVNREVPK